MKNNTIIKSAKIFQGIWENRKQVASLKDVIMILDIAEIVPALLVQPYNEVMQISGKIVKNIGLNENAIMEIIFKVKGRGTLQGDFYINPYIKNMTDEKRVHFDLVGALIIAEI